MELGHVVDYCIEWNQLNEPEDPSDSKKKKTNKRKANQSDWDAFLG